MQFLRIAILVSLPAICVAPALAQYGTYGSPDLLRMPADLPAPQMQPSMQAWSVSQTSLPTPAPAPAQNLMPANPMPNPVVSNQMPTDNSTGGCGYQNGCGQITPALENWACGTKCCPWYGSILALTMCRDNPNKLWTSYEDGNEPNQLPTFPHLAWRWGGEIRLGYRFCDCCCRQWALEASFWALDDFEGFVSVTNPNGVSTPLNTSDVEFNGVSAENWFDGAAEHCVTRRDEFQSVEFNLVRERMNMGCSSPWSIDWLAGARYFRFKEEWTLASLQDGWNWGDEGGIHEVYLRDRITNNFWGFQFGFNAEFYLLRNLRLVATPKFGIYDNHIEHYFQLNLGDGANADTGSSGVVGTYPVWSQTDQLSFLTQIDLGLDWMFTERLSARVGYRVLAITGVGLSDTQIPPYLVDIPAIADIDTNANLILHGAYMGLTYNF
jgi:hypothetical protein